jgi:hypothetical protein
MFNVFARTVESHRMPNGVCVTFLSRALAPVGVEYKTVVTDDHEGSTTRQETRVPKVLERPMFDYVAKLQTQEPFKTVLKGQPLGPKKSVEPVAPTPVTAAKRTVAGPSTPEAVFAALRATAIATSVPRAAAVGAAVSDSKTAARRKA